MKNIIDTIKRIKGKDVKLGFILCSDLCLEIFASLILHI